MSETKLKKDMKDLGQGVVEKIEKKKDPEIKLPVRALSNVYFDEKSKIIRLGSKVMKRTYLNVAHTRKFMQTLMVAAECRKIIDQNVTTSIRDLYYALKRTIEGTSENTFEDQNESLCPDEPVLVRMGNGPEIVPVREAMGYAYKTGKVTENNGKTVITDVPMYTYAFDTSLKIREHKVKAVLKHKSKEAVELKTSSGRKVKITPYHSLFTLNEEGSVESVRVSDIRKGSYVALPRKIRIRADNMVINVVEILLREAPGSVLKKIYLKGSKELIKKILSSLDRERLKKFIKKNYRTRWSDVICNWKTNSTLPVSLTREFDISMFLPKLRISARGGRHSYSPLINKDYNLGFILGLLLSEGSHSSLTRKIEERAVSLSNRSIGIIRDFMRKFEKTFKGSCTSKKPALQKDGTYKINIGYNLFSYILEYVLSYPVSRSWDKKIPPAIFNAPEPCVEGFLEGFRKGDGNVFKPKFRIRFHTSSLNIVNGLSFLLLRLGIFSNIYEYPKQEKHHHPMYEVRVGSGEYVKKLAPITKDFKNTRMNKKSSMSGDRIPNIGRIINKIRKGCKIPESVYKKINWHDIEDESHTISRATLGRVIKILEKHNPKSNEIPLLKQLINGDLFWDTVKEIRACEKPEYTVDFAVNPTQNFIGGNGLLILHNSDPVIEDLEAALNCLREELHLKADRKGYVAGNLVINDAGDEIDCSKMGSSGWGIPSDVEPDMIKFKKCDADFVLMTEKDAVWQRLNEDKFWKKQNCLIVTGKGQPARGARRLINRFHKELKLPVYVLTDSDPWGYYIYSVIKQGSINLSFLSDRLGTPDAKFIGLTTQDVPKFGIPKNVTIKMNEGDKKRTKEMLKYIWFKPKEWQHELKNMLNVGFKLELEALSAKGIKFISNNYLPEKIANKEFLP